MILYGEVHIDQIKENKKLQNVCKILMSGEIMYTPDVVADWKSFQLLRFFFRVLGGLYNGCNKGSKIMRQQKHDC